MPRLECGIGYGSGLFLANSAETWPDLLKARHNAALRGDVSTSDLAVHVLGHWLELYNADALVDHPADVEQDPWPILFEHDIISVVLDLLCDFDFDADIRACRLIAVRNHLSDLLVVFATTIDRLFTVWRHTAHKARSRKGCPECAAVDRAVSALTTLAPTALLNIWEARSLLFNTDRESVVRPNCISPWYSIYGAVCFVTYHFSRLCCTHSELWDPLRPTMIQVGRLCLGVWIYALEKSHRSRALENLVGALNCACPGYQYNAWYLEACTGVPDPSHIAKTFLRDFRDQDVLGATLARNLMFVFYFRDPVALVHLYNNKVERSTFWYAMAAYRRQLCSGHLHEDGPHTLPEENVAERTFDYVSMTLLTSLKVHNDKRDPNGPLIPLIYIHAALPVLSTMLVLRMTEDIRKEAGPGYDRQMCNTIAHCGWLIQQHSFRPFADTEAGFVSPSTRMRQLSRKYWQDARDTMMARRYHINLTWKPIYKAWNLLGIALDQNENAFIFLGRQADVEFEPVKRCAWKECLCSAYKPAHKLKVCRGCWAVAYCNQKCRDSDWENHRSRCAGRGLKE